MALLHYNQVMGERGKDPLKWLSVNEHCSIDVVISNNYYITWIFTTGNAAAVKDPHETKVSDMFLNKYLIYADDINYTQEMLFPLPLFSKI